MPRRAHYSGRPLLVVIVLIFILAFALVRVLRLR
jgi:hypothetical protein